MSRPYVWQVLYSHTHAEKPPPIGMGRYIQWVAEGLFCRIDTLEFRQPSERWAFASSCLRVMMQVVYDHDPDESTDEDPRLSTGAPAAAPPALPAPPAVPGVGMGAPDAPAASTDQMEELPAGFQLLCAFVKPHSPLFGKLLWLVTNSSFVLSTAGPHPPEQYNATALAIRFLQVKTPWWLALLPEIAPSHSHDCASHAASAHPNIALTPLVRMQAPHAVALIPLLCCLLVAARLFPL